MATTNGIQLPTSAPRQSIVKINVTVQNISNKPTWSTLSVTIYDEVNVPICSFITSNNTAVGNSIVKATVTIPTWAFVGKATVYIDILTNTPSADGVPYCPEKVANFQILP